MGSRLGEKTKLIPKCMVSVNETKIIDHLLKSISHLKVENLVLVTGHLADTLINHVQSKWAHQYPLVFINNPIYDKTNNIYSLWLANEYMQQEYMIIESDVFADPKAFDSMHLDKNTWMVDHFTEKMDGCMLTAQNQTRISKIEIIREKLNEYLPSQFKSVGIVKICQQNMLILDLLEHEINQGNTNIYYDLFFAKYIDQIELHIANIHPLKWIEIDNQNDLDLACNMFSELE